MKVGQGGRAHTKFLRVCKNVNDPTCGHRDVATKPHRPKHVSGTSYRASLYLALFPPGALQSRSPFPFPSPARQLMRNTTSMLGGLEAGAGAAAVALAVLNLTAWE